MKNDTTANHEIFSIDTHNYNLSLVVTLIQVADTGNNDATAPTSRVTPDNITYSSTAHEKSTETDTV